MSSGFSYTSETFYITLVAIPFIVIIFIAFMGINISAQQGSIECLDYAYRETMMIKTITSSSCFAYYDSTLGKPILGSINLDNFTSDNLENCFPFLGLTALENLQSQRVIDLSMSVDLGDTKVGTNVTNPHYVNKLVYVYKDGSLLYDEPQQVRFEFEEVEC